MLKARSTEDYAIYLLAGIGPILGVNRLGKKRRERRASASLDRSQKFEITLATKSSAVKRQLGPNVQFG